MRRREFITLLGGAAATWPLAVRAQQPAMPVVSLLRSTPAAPFDDLVAALRQGLNETGSAMSSSSSVGPTINSTGCRLTRLV